MTQNRFFDARYKALVDELTRVAAAKDPLTRWDSDAVTEEDIYFCYRLIYGRKPSPGEWPTYREAEGTGLQPLVRNFLNSKEARSRFELGDTPEKVALDEFSIFILQNDISVSRYIRSGTYEPNVSTIFKRYLKPGMTVVDIGANLGYFTLLSAKLVGPNGRVVAIEANPRNARLLSASVKLNAFEHVRMIPVAAGREAGVLSLNEDFSNGITAPPSSELSALLSSTLVPCVALDSVVPADRPIDFVKIDIEGAEMNALSGFRETIERDRPIIVSEFSPGALQVISRCSGSDYLKFLVERSYNIGIIESDGSVTDYRDDWGQIMVAVAKSGAHHIDICAIAR